MNRKKALVSFVIVAMLLCGSLAFPVRATSSDWSKPRPSKSRVYDETIGNSKTDGAASIGMGVHIYQYFEGVSDEKDFLHFKVSASANTRVGIEYEYQSHGFGWLEVSEPTGITGDDDGDWLDLRVEFGFTFLYYGVEYDKIWVCSNGFICLDSERTDATPSAIPSTDEPNTIIAPFWRDLKPNRSGSITYGVRLFDIHEFFVVSWNNVPDANGNPQTFQLLIEIRQGGDDFHNRIYFQYENITTDLPTSIGVENQLGDNGYSFNLSDIDNEPCLGVYPSVAGNRLTRLTIKLTKSDGYAKIEVEETDTGGCNVKLEDYSNPYGDDFKFAIKTAATALLWKAGIIWKGMLIVADLAGVLANDVSPVKPEYTQDALESDNEAWAYGDCIVEGRSDEPFDSTLATTISWKFTDASNRDHNLTVTAEAWYEDLSNGNGYTVCTSSTLNMYTGYHYVDIDTTIDGSETTGVKVWIDDAEYSSPVSRMPLEGTHTIKVESPIYIDSVKYRFQTWSDGIDENPRTVGLYSDLNVSALYKAVYCLEILVPSGGGTTDPSPGTHEYLNGTILTVSAIPDEGFIFAVWNLDGQCLAQNPITVTMNSDHTLKAYFNNATGGGGGSEPCPTLYVWNGTAWIDYGVIDIHNPSGEDVVREVPVQAEDVGISRYKATFRLREGWLGLNFSESVIDQVKLYAINENGNHMLCPLIKAEHSRLGNVLLRLLASDNWKTQILLLETISLKFIVPYQLHKIQNFTFTIEGCNMLKL